VSYALEAESLSIRGSLISRIMSLVRPSVYVRLSRIRAANSEKNVEKQT